MDSSPIVIAPRSSAVHVASNGEDFLAVIDTGTNVIAVPVSNGGAVGKETTIFDWFAGGTESNVAGDGHNYLIVWRYGAATKNWLGSARFTVGGTLHSLTSVETGFSDNFRRPAVAANMLGDAMLAISEVRDENEVGRVRAYLSEDLRPNPRPPSPPRWVTAVGTPSEFVVSWENTSNDVAGFVIERVGIYPWRVTIPGDQQTMLLRGFIADRVWVRAFNAGGLSEPSESVAVMPPPRRRVTGAR
jgi:hypothetical protein